MKLQKLLYFLYARYLYMTRDLTQDENGRSLFSNRFEAVTNGPDLVSIHNAFTSNNLGEKSSIGSNYFKEADGVIYAIDEENSPVFKKCLEEVLERFGGYDGEYLSNLTHEDGTAWTLARNRGDDVLRDSEVIVDGERFFKDLEAAS
ncbi:MAG: DUF4065 domain-containing protein [Defluviitaleaceae bacterium]|nr:DUF4065 domain-containing protein [Defluviitaleaceae bacterium]